VAVLKRIAPGSAFKVALVVYALLGLIVGFFVSLITLLGLRLPCAPCAAHLHSRYGLIYRAAVIVFPIVYGIIGGVAWAIGTFIYNLVARWVGGLEVDIS
jgi:uncharacterized protein (DUF2062 family)